VRFGGHTTKSYAEAQFLRLKEAEGAAWREERRLERKRERTGF